MIYPMGAAMKKYKIEKNTVQETLVIPLYGRWLCSQRYPHLFQDENAAGLMKRIDYDFSELERRSAGLWSTWAVDWTALDGTVTMEAVKYITLICRMSSG